MTRWGKLRESGPELGVSGRVPRRDIGDEKDKCHVDLVRDSRGEPACGRSNFAALPARGGCTAPIGRGMHNCVSRLPRSREPSKPASGRPAENAFASGAVSAAHAASSKAAPGDGCGGIVCCTMDCKVVEGVASPRLNRGCLSAQGFKVLKVSARLDRV